MTVCIAAITREDYIVVATDLMVAGYMSSTDSSMVKVEEIHKEWAVLLAADDLTQCVPIIEKAKEYFRGRANTLLVARSTLKRAFQQHLAELAADCTLGRFGLSMKDFVSTG